jgi:HlyD family secretion protein
MGVLVLSVGAGVGVYMRYGKPTHRNLEGLLAAVTQSNLQTEITTSGVVQPSRSVNLSPKTAGILVSLAVEQGDRVQQGQVIAQMDDRDLQAQRVQAEGRLAQAQANLLQLQRGSRPEEVARAQDQVRQNHALIQQNQARVELAQVRLRRNQALRKEGAIAQDALDASQSEVDQALAALRQSQAQWRTAQQQLQQLENGERSETIAQAQAQVTTAEGQLQSLKVQLEDTVIRAPFAGIITQRYADPGAFVTPTTSASTNASATSTSIVALAEGLEVLANVPEVDFGQIYPGQSVNIVADTYPDQVFIGKVHLIAPEAVKEQNVTSFQVRIRLVNGLEKLRSGMNVDITFVGQVLQSAVVAPTAAIVTVKGKTGLLVPGADGQTPAFRPVIIGTTVGEKTQILEGVKPGEKIFVNLPPGIKLEDIVPQGE